MDKTLTFIIIGLLALCAGFVSWAALEGPKMSRRHKWFSYGYVTLLWSFLIILVVIATIY